MMNVRIYTDRVERELTNFWNHIHFHPTDAAEDLWGQEILSHVARDKVAQYVRLHTMFEDIVTRGADGRLRFDYSGSDRRIDIMVSKGFRLLLCFDFMPPCMAVDQWNVSNLRYKNKRYNRSVPTDYAEWREVCRNYTAHLAERYGMDTVSEWLFHCWNEPDAGYWVSRPGNDEWDASGATDKLDEYLKLYDHFAEGVTSVTDRIRIGGPSCAGSDRFIRLFVQHVAQTKIRCDFISVHCYSQGIYSNLPNKSFTSPDNIMQRLRTLRGILDGNGLAETPMLLDEWGISGGGFLGIDREPRHIFRENEYYSAFYARLIDRVIHAPELKLEKMMICLSGQDHVKKDFDGYRTFFTANGYRKPVYNGYALAARLGSRLLFSESEDSAASAVVIPTADADGSVRILCANFEDDYYRTIDNLPMVLRLSGMNGTYRLCHWRIDRTCSNSYSKWASLGCPQLPSMLERDMIRSAGELSRYQPERTVTADGAFELELLLTQNAVSLLEFIPVRDR